MCMKLRLKHKSNIVKACGAARRACWRSQETGASQRHCETGQSCMWTCPKPSASKAEPAYLFSNLSKTSCTQTLPQHLHLASAIDRLANALKLVPNLRPSAATWHGSNETDAANFSICNRCQTAGPGRADTTIENFVIAGGRKEQASTAHGLGATTSAVDMQHFKVM